MSAPSIAEPLPKLSYAGVYEHSSPSTTSVQQVKVIPSSPLDFRSHDYYSALLELALEKTSNIYGDAVVVETEGRMMQDRAFSGLNAKSPIDVFWSVTSQEREDQAIPVRVPLLNGIMGYRVSLIKRRDAYKFSHQAAVKKLIAGQGHDWPDLEILSKNGFLVWGASNYDSIIDLLRKERIDHFPRAINEVVFEYEYHNDNTLAIEPDMLLYYPSLIFFFVAKDKPLLAQRILLGLKIAKDDGSFDALFEQYIDLLTIDATLDLSSRKIIVLDNPFLSDKTKLLSNCLMPQEDIMTLLTTSKKSTTHECVHPK